MEAIAAAGAAVTAVEDHRSAVADGERSAELNGIAGVTFVRAAVERALPALEGDFDGVVLDPPRRGCHPAVIEAAVIGVPHEIKGQEVVCFCVLRPEHEASEALRQALQTMVIAEMGKALQPKAIKFVSALPKTRNAKVMHRVIRAAYLGHDPGDLSSLENPATLEAIKHAA